MTKIEIQHIEITNDVILHRKIGSELNEGNITCINDDAGLIFIDAGRVAEDAKNFRSTMEKKFGKKASCLILTHVHQDHLFGIEAFKDLPIYASAVAVQEYNTAEKEGKFSIDYRKGVIEAIKERAAKGEFDLFDAWYNDHAINYVNAKVYPPTDAINEEKQFGSNGKQLQFKVVGGHTPDSSFLYYMPDNVLIAGDNFNANHSENSACMLANLTEEGIKILKMFEELDPKHVIPGHGPAVTKDYITKSREYFEATFAKMKELKIAGLSLEEVKNHPDLPEFFEQEKHQQWDRIMSSWYTQL